MNARSIVLALLASPLRLRECPQDPVKAELVHAWPKVMGRGYFPVWVELQNVSHERQTVELVASCGMSNNETVTRKSVVLAADESRRVELFVPIFSAGPSGYYYGGWDGCSLNMSAGGRRSMLGSGFAQRLVDADLRTVLVLAKEKHDDAEQETLVDHASTKSLDLRPERDAERRRRPPLASPIRCPRVRRRTRASTW
jgi:hypothetical protein